MYHIKNDKCKCILNKINNSKHNTLKMYYIWLTFLIVMYLFIYFCDIRCAWGRSGVSVTLCAVVVRHRQGAHGDSHADDVALHPSIHLALAQDTQPWLFRSSSCCSAQLHLACLNRVCGDPDALLRRCCSIIMRPAVRPLLVATWRHSDNIIITCVSGIRETKRGGSDWSTRLQWVETDQNMLSSSDM